MDDDELDIGIDEAGDQQQPKDDDGADAAGGDDGEPEGETVIAFADEAETEDDEEEPTPLVKKLRDQLREVQGQLAKQRRAPATPANDGDPEPAIPPKKALEEFDYDQDKADAYNDEREKKLVEHAKWETRQSEREAERNRAAEKQAKAIEQQRNSLGVSDYEDRAETVKAALSDAQMAVLVNGAQNPAKVIYALGRSPSKLEQLAAEDNLARFAFMAGNMERDIKVTKRAAPAADTPVRGATASGALNDRTAKQLQKLEREAARTGDRTALIQFKKQMNKAA